MDHMDYQVDLVDPSSTGREVSLDKGKASQKHPEAHSTASASTPFPRTVASPQSTEVVSSRVLVNLTSSSVNLYTGNPYYALNPPSNPLETPVNVRNPVSGQQLQVGHTPSDPHDVPSQSLGTIRHEEVGLQASNRIYERHMLTRGRGYPLWIPEGDLSLPIEKKRLGVSIGDVGMVTSPGSFSYLFNILLPVDDPLQPEEMPEGFTPIAPLGPASVFFANEFKKNSALSSVSMKKLETPGLVNEGISGTSLLADTEQKFELLLSEGAVLALPDGARSSRLQKQLLGWRRYMATHIENWYRYVIGTLECEVQNGDIRLVIGSDQTTFWGIAVAEHPPSSPDRCLLRFRPSALATTSERYAWDYNGVVTPRTGPSQDEVMQFGWDLANESQIQPNQCLFVRSLNVTLSEDKWARISEEFGLEQWLDNDVPLPHRPLGSLSTGERASGSHAPSSPFHHNQRSHTRLYTDNHPADLVNQMLLALSPTAWAALTNDDDWCKSLLYSTTNDKFDPTTMLCRVFLGANIEQVNGIVQLKMKCNEENCNSPFLQQLFSIYKNTMGGPIEDHPTGESIKSLLLVFDALIAFYHGVEALKSSASPSAGLLNDSSIWSWPFFAEVFRPLDHILDYLRPKQAKPEQLLFHSASLSMSPSDSLASADTLVASRDDLDFKIHEWPHIGYTAALGDDLDAAYSAYRVFRQTHRIEDLKRCTRMYLICISDRSALGDNPRPQVGLTDRPPSPCSPKKPMSHASLLSLAGVPELEAGIAQCTRLVTATYSGIEAVKVYKPQCLHLSDRCRTLLTTLRDCSESLDHEKALRITDEIDFIIQGIYRRVMEWGSWGKLKSFLQQREIKDGIDKLHRDLDAAIMKFNIGMSLEMTHGNVESRLVKARDQSELKELLQSIISNHTEMKALLNMTPASNSQDPGPVEEVMESLQTVLWQSELRPIEKKVFEDGLWDLHRQTSKLPPLTDLTGQVELSGGLVASGSYNNIYQGHWLNQEMVALRLPRTLSDNEDVQKRFIREVSVWRGLKHPNIVPLYGVVYIEDQLFAVSPWMGNNTSISYVVRYPNCDRLKVLNEAAEGLDYLHRKNIVHGDLRAENVLVSRDGVSKLSNFGLSSCLEDCGTRVLSSANLKPGWTAPELLQGRGTVSSFSDIWSFGSVCLEVLLVGCTTQLDFVMRDLYKGKIPKRPKNVDMSDEMWKLMSWCWSPKPDFRPTSNELKHNIAKLRQQTPAIDTNAQSTSRPLGLLGRKPTIQRPSPASSDKSHTTANKIFSRPSLQNEKHLSEYHVGELEHRPEAEHLFHASHTPQNFIDPITPLDPKPSTGPSEQQKRLGSMNSDRPSYVMPRQNSRQMTLTSMGTHDHGGHTSRPGTAERQNSRLFTSDSGDVISGTLEGLVEQLIINFNLRRGVEYRHIFLSTYLDFTTPLDLFQILCNLFDELEMTTSRHADDRGAMQYNIFMVLQYWLTRYRRSITDDLLEKIRYFCVNAISIKGSIPMIEPLAQEVMQCGDKLLLHPEQPPRSLSPSLAVQQMLDASQISPKDLAIALTILEGDAYNRLEPCDYMAHLTCMEGYNNVQDVYDINNKIVSWVRSRVLQFDKVKERAEVMKFLVLTAAECLELRNFSSLSAIMIALQSWPIEGLKRTRAAMPLRIQIKLYELGNITNPTSNHRRYREALNGFTRDGVPGREDRMHHQPGCVPWLAIHLKELDTTLQSHTRTLQFDSQRLVNFTRYVRFMERLNESLAYHCAPNLEKYRRQGSLEYLETKLKGVEMGQQEEEKQIARSKDLQARERSLDEELDIL